MTIPTERPAQLTAGDTWRWTRELADYPAGTWTLTYYFESQAYQFSAAASASGTKHAVTVAAATTAGYRPGRYKVHARVTDGTIAESLPAESGWVDVLPNFATTVRTDPRTWAERVLDALKATYEGRASKDQVAMSIGDRSISLMSRAELRAEIEAFERRVAAEQTAAAITAGRPTRNRILVRG